MKKKFISKMLFVALTLGALGIVSSCSDDDTKYDSDIANLQAQIDKNSKAIDQINSLITDGSFIQSVDNDADGVLITLSNGKTYRISNGTNGQDAVVWTIGEDGFWYQNGNKTNYYALGKDGKDGTNGTNGSDGKDGANGTDGKDGTNGSDGQDGIYYYPNPDTGKFDIYNADGTLKEHTDIVWLASGANAITAVMDQNELKLYNVQTADGTTSVTIALSNNLRGFVFSPKAYVDGLPAIRVTSFAYNALTLKNKDSQNETTTAATSATVINPTTYAEYHVNPANANVEDLKNLKFVVRANDDYVKTRAAASADFDVAAEFVSFEDGILKVKVDVTGTPATNEKISVVALQTQKSNGEDVTSDYATVYKNDMADLAIADKQKFSKSTPEDYHFRRFINALDAQAGISQYTVWQLDDNLETIDAILYHGEKLDLTELVEAHELTAQKHTVADLEALGMSFKYELVSNYIIGSNQTDQKEYVQLSDGILEENPVYGAAAIDKTPIVRVSLMNGSKIVKVAYIKVKIQRRGNTPVAPDQLEVSVNKFTFECGQTGVVKTDFRQMSLIYAGKGMSKEEFHNYYRVFNDEADASDVGTVREINTGDNQSAEGTHVLEWTIGEQDLWDHAGEDVSNVIRYYTSAGSQTYYEIKLMSHIDGVQKLYNIVQENKISNYWTSDLSAALFNARVPQSTSDRNPNNCYFLNDLNAPFVTNDAGTIKLDRAVTFVEYSFHSSMAGSKKIGNETYSFAISSDGLTLTVNGEVIAQISNNNTTAPFNSISYNKNSDIAKKLLNTDAMYVLIKATGYACDDYNKPVRITFDGLDYFRANYKRPVDITDLAADNFIDGVDFGEKGSYIKLEDLIYPSDWRGRAFSSYPNYWDFYGPFSVSFDPADAECDLNGTRQAIPTSMELEQVAGTTFSPNSNYGFITYKNNGMTVSQPFNIFVKVTVNYGWGDLKTDWITVPVKTTIGQ